MSVRRCVVVPPLPVCGTCLIPEGEGARRNPQHTHKYIQHITHRLTHKYTVHITHKYTFYMTHKQTWNLSKNLHRQIFRLKIFTTSISPNFNNFTKKKSKKMSENGEIYTVGKKIYTAAGIDGSLTSEMGYIRKWVGKLGN